MNFETTVVWNQKFPGKIHCQNGQVIEYSAPVELKGMQGTLTPEDAFVGAANMCYQIVFQYVSRDLGIDLVEYRCKAVGDLEVVDGVKKFVKITLYPEMRFAPGSNMSNLEKAISTTKRKCLVTNSMDLEVDVVPKVL
ncbi:MAG: OsmC family protein [Thermoplasmata archaeon]|jgi:organic hydroperoxide reductase OsmC/OhrA|nr:OsmC family protein [Thermoplasmata archaeon]